MPNKSEFYDSIQKVLDIGVDKVRIFTQLHPFDVVVPGLGFGLVNGNKSNWTECEVREQRYKVTDGYKITLQPLNHGYAHQDFYQCDFDSLVKCGLIVIKTSDSQHLEHIKWAEPLYGSYTLVTEADILVKD